MSSGEADLRAVSKALIWLLRSPGAIVARVEMFLGIAEGQASEGSGGVRVDVHTWVQSQEAKEPLLADGQKLVGHVQGSGNCPVLRLDRESFASA